MSAITLNPEEELYETDIDIQYVAEHGVFSEEFEVESDFQSDVRRDYVSRINIASAPWDLGTTLVERILSDPDLDESLLSSLKHISRHLENEDYDVRDLVAYIDSNDDTVYEFPVIRVGVNLSDVTEWERLESDIEDIIERAEVGETVIYSIVDPRDE